MTKGRWRSKWGVTELQSDVTNDETLSNIREVLAPAPVGVELLAWLGEGKEGYVRC